jgi:predicted nucleic acid-binding protein
MVTAVDTSVLLDVLLDDPKHASTSLVALHRAAAEGSLVISETSLAEVVPVLKPGDLQTFFDPEPSEKRDEYIKLAHVFADPSEGMPDYL